MKKKATNAGYLVLLTVLFFSLMCDSKVPTEPEPVTSWESNKLGDLEWMTKSMAVGQGRNDGLNRLYIGSYGGRYIAEYSYTSGWNEYRITFPQQTIGLPTGIAVGDGRNDGMNRVYMGSTNGNLYEFTYSSGQWTIDAIIPAGGVENIVTSVCTGDARGDGISRLYSVSGYGRVREFTYNDTTWQEAFVDSEYYNQDYSDLNISVDGLNGPVRLYASNRDQGLIRYSYSGNGWEKIPLVNGDMFYQIESAGSQGPVFLLGFNTLYEATDVSGTWQTDVIRKNVKGGWGIKLAVGDVRNNGTLSAYTFGVDEDEGMPLLEHTYKDGAWNTATISWFLKNDDLDEVGIISGDLRDDGITRLYMIAQVSPVGLYSVYELAPK